MKLAREGRRTSHRVFRDMVRIGEGDSPSISDLYALLLCINRMERIGDQAKNICEETVFSVTGETKAPKVYRVQFVDRGNDAASIMAEAIARTSYPESGEYSSSGWQPDAASGFCSAFCWVRPSFCGVSCTPTFWQAR